MHNVSISIHGVNEKQFDALIAAGLDVQESEGYVWVTARSPRISVTLFRDSAIEKAIGQERA